MNERMKVLSEQANQYGLSNVNRDSEFFHTIAMAKFAELIVTDCLDVVAMRIYLGPVEMCRQECKALASEIKEHFGVNE